MLPKCENFWEVSFWETEGLRRHSKGVVSTVTSQQKGSWFKSQLDFSDCSLKGFKWSAKKQHILRICEFNFWKLILIL